MYLCISYKIDIDHDDDYDYYYWDDLTDLFTPDSDDHNSGAWNFNELGPSNPISSENNNNLKSDGTTHIPTASVEPDRRGISFTSNSTKTTGVSHDDINGSFQNLIFIYVININKF